MSEVLYSIARDTAGELVRITDARNGHAYFCCECKAEMVAKRGPQNRFHFAHKAKADCIGEGDLHFFFKDTLYKRLVDGLKTGTPVKIDTGMCFSCGFHNTGNLLKNISFVEIEYDMGVCRPDIALLESDRSVRAAIEVVVTHWPSDTASAFYESNKIHKIIFDLGFYKEIPPILPDQDILGMAGADILEPYKDCFDGKRLKCKKCGRYTE